MHSMGPEVESSYCLHRLFTNHEIRWTQEQTTAHVLWLASDHMHLYIDATPDYALDEIVHAIREYVEHAMTHLFPELQHSNQPVWEPAYFAEGIG
jgi:REP element-mobilizing transposase RayT